jgi:hypothetical protein
MGHGVSPFLPEPILLALASKYTLFFQQREEKSAMLEEAPARVAFLTRPLHASSRKKVTELTKKQRHR